MTGGSSCGQLFPYSRKCGDGLVDVIGRDHDLYGVADHGQVAEQWQAVLVRVGIGEDEELVVTDITDNVFCVGNQLAALDNLLHRLLLLLVCDG